jgi:hypothetical protein
MFSNWNLSENIRIVGMLLFYIKHTTTLNVAHLSMICYHMCKSLKMLQASKWLSYRYHVTNSCIRHAVIVNYMQLKSTTVAWSEMA